jgi:RNA polymerase sigma factor (sigma-70 family)
MATLEAVRIGDHSQVADDNKGRPSPSTPDEEILLLLHDPAMSSLGAELCYRKYEAFCLRIAATWSTDSATAHDAAHDALAHFIEREINPTRASFRSGFSIAAYLAAAIRNAFHDAFRRRRREDVASTDENDDDPLESIAAAELPAIEQLIASEQRAIVEQCVGKLKPIDAEILTLRYTDELTLQEIADRLGLVPSTVSYRIEKALGHLRRLLEESGLQGGQP